MSIMIMIPTWLLIQLSIILYMGALFVTSGIIKYSENIENSILLRSTVGNLQNKQQQQRGYSKGNSNNNNEVLIDMSDVYLT